MAPRYVCSYSICAISFSLSALCFGHKRILFHCPRIDVCVCVCVCVHAHKLLHRRCIHQLRNYTKPSILILLSELYGNEISSSESARQKLFTLPSAANYHATNNCFSTYAQIYTWTILNDLFISLKENFYDRDSRALFPYSVSVSVPRLNARNSTHIFKQYLTCVGFINLLVSGNSAQAAYTAQPAKHCALPGTRIIKILLNP
jgi:hypothetical protein